MGPSLLIIPNTSANPKNSINWQARLLNGVPATIDWRKLTISPPDISRWRTIKDDSLTLKGFFFRGGTIKLAIADRDGHQVEVAGFGLGLTTSLAPSVTISDGFMPGKIVSTEGGSISSTVLLGPAGIGYQRPEYLFSGWLTLVEAGVSGYLGSAAGKVLCFGNVPLLAATHEQAEAEGRQMKAYIFMATASWPNTTKIFPSGSIGFTYFMTNAQYRSTVLEGT
jgi:hypothetical protein